MVVAPALFLQKSRKAARSEVIFISIAICRVKSSLVLVSLGAFLLIEKKACYSAPKWPKDINQCIFSDFCSNLLVKIKTEFWGLFIGFFLIQKCFP